MKPPLYNQEELTWSLALQIRRELTKQPTNQPTNQLTGLIKWLAESEKKALIICNIGWVYASEVVLGLQFELQNLGIYIFGCTKTKVCQTQRV